MFYNSDVFIAFPIEILLLFVSFKTLLLFFNLKCYGLVFAFSKIQLANFGTLAYTPG